MKNYLSKLFVALALVFFGTGVSKAADYYWVGGAGDWSDLTHWATTSGGSTTHFIPPGPTDDVIFDANSGFSSGNNIVTTSSSIYCRNMIWNGAPANPVFNESQSDDLLMYGSLTLQAGMTFNARVLFTGGTFPATITSNGTTINGAVEIEKGSSSLTLADSLIVKFVSNNSIYAISGAVVLTSGTFDLNENNLYATTFFSNNNLTRHLDMTNATIYLRNTLSGISTTTNLYANPGTQSVYAFYFGGNNKTVAAGNSLIRTENCGNPVFITGGSQLTFHNLSIKNTYATGTVGYISRIGNSIFNVISTDQRYCRVQTSPGAQIDSLLFNVVTPWAGSSSSMSQYSRLEGSGAQINHVEFFGLGIVSGSSNTINTLYFNQIGNAPAISYNGITGFSNTVTRTEFRNYDGRIASNSNNLEYVEFFENGYITGTNNVMDTLVLAPGYAYRLGSGVSNTVTSALYGSGNPCYLTEILNVTTSGTATLTVNSSAQVYLDYMRARGVIAAGTGAPFTTGSHSLDLGNNTNWSFAAYDPGAPLEGVGTDTLLCPSSYPLTLDASGFVGSPSTTYTWYDGSSGLTHDVNGPGTYWVSADYGRGCLLTDSITVTDRFEVSFSGHGPVCDPSSPDGMAVAVVSGSSGPYTYSWNSSPVQTDDTLVNVPAGMYTVSITDASGCTYMDSTEIVGPSTGLAFGVDIPASGVYPDCDPSSGGTGSATAVATGGSTPYSLDWNTVPAQSAESIFNLNSGSYQVVATDANGCVDSAAVTITGQPGAFTANVTVTNPTGCDTTGSALVTLVGGLAPFSYTWTNDPLETTDSSTDIPVGAYGVTIVDDNSCLTNVPFEVISPDSIPPSFVGCPSDTIISTELGMCSATYSWVPPVASDSCGLQSIVGSHTPGTSFPIGSTTVSYIATDVVGNVDTCSFVVTVQDTEAPHFTICPSDRVIVATVGNCTAAVNWTPPVAVDNCSGTITVVGDFTSGTAFPVGTTTVTYVATDVSGNMDTCQFRVVVKSHPSNFFVSSCNSNQTWFLPNSQTCYRTITLGVPTISNLCGNYSLIPGPFVPGQSYDFPVGLTNIVHQYTNGADTISCNYTITVIDQYNPSWTSGPGTVNLVADTCGGTYASWIPPVPFDACGIDTVYSNYSPGDFFTTGTTEVTYTAVDVNGRVRNYDFNVNVSDPAPVISGCPSNITALADTCGGKRVTWILPTASDNCITSFTSSHNPGDLFPIGTTTVTYTVTSENGATATCSFSVTVNPFNPSIAACPSDMVIDLDAVTCDTAVVWTPPTFTHPCGIDTVIASHTPGDTLLPGVYNVSYEAISNDGFSSVCFFTITVNAFAAPITVSGCPANHPVYGTPWYTQQVDTVNFCGEVVASWPEPTFTTSFCSSPVDTVVLTSPFAMSDTVALGMYTIKYEAFDSLGVLLDSCVFTYEVVDTISGVFASNCPSSAIVQQVDVSAFCGGVVASFNEPVFTSTGCGSTVDTVISNVYPGDTLLLGTHFVSYQALDSNGIIIGQCDFNIDVIDTVSGVIATCPPLSWSSNFGQDVWNIFVDTMSCQAIADWPTPTFTSAGCENSVHTVNSNYSVGDVLPGGLTYVNYYAYDSLGTLLAECVFPVVVQYDIYELVEFPSDTTFVTDPTTCFATVNWDAPVVNTVCGFTPFWFVNASNEWNSNNLDLNGSNVNQQFPVGDFELYYQVYNGVQYITHTFTIHVLDGSAPTFGTSCPTDTVVIANNFNSCEGLANWVDPVAVPGPCSDPSMVVTFDANFSSGDLLPVGNTDIIYTATSTGGASATCQFVASVIDVQDPVFNTCPTDITVDAAAASCDAMVTWVDPTAFDNCPGVTITASHTPGSAFPIGTTNVTYVAMDASGNTDSCSFNVTVLDNVAPVISSCPSNITVSNDPNVCGANVTWIEPIAVDNCGMASLTSSHVNGSLFPIGTTTVTYMATDTVGNSTTCSFDITVVDSQVPALLNCPSDISVNTDFNLCAAIVNWIPPTAGDNCNGSSLITSTHAPGEIFPLGTTMVTYYIVDQAGNEDSCSFNVTVVDTHAPSITACPPSQTIAAEAGSCGAVATWTTPIALDNCSGVTLTSNYNSGDTFPVGMTTVTYTATDAQGLTAQCSFIITVVDQQAPVFTNAPSDMTLSVDSVGCNAVASWSSPTVTDNCSSSATVTSNYNSGDVFPLGTTLVTYTASDSLGNVSTHSFTITVVDTVPPMFTNCSGDVTIEAAADSCGSVVSWNEPSESDNCGVALVTNSHNSGDYFEIGTTTVTYIVTDNSGNTDTCTFNVNVIGNEASCDEDQKPEVIVPEAFTPDGDGMNDVFVIEGISAYPYNTLTIFNRWGSVVYEVNNYSNDWNGVSNVGAGLLGENLPSGTYFYVLDTKDPAQGVVKGYVYLQR